jgi:hypothetical protein
MSNTGKAAGLGCLAIGGIALAAVVVLLVGAFGYVGSVKREGIRQETQLAAQYTANQNALSTYVKTVKEQAGIVRVQSAQLDTVLRDAVQGRYGTGGFQSNGQLISAMREAYPDLSQLAKAQDRLFDAISAGRTEFKNKQDELAQRVAVYDAWTNDGVIRPFFVKMYFPSNVLRVRKGDGFVTGEAALQMIRTQVLDDRTLHSFETGKEEAIDFGAPADGTVAASRDTTHR